MTDSQRNIMVSSALPYANGSIHMGHLVEYIQSDIWARFQKLRGHRCTYVCAADAHGTPIMIRAREEGVSPENLVTRIAAEQLADLESFGVAFDNFHSTHSQENRELVERIYRALRDNGHVYTETIEQAYDEQENMFLPDRFVKGTCPRCKSPDQYGDACEVCGATYNPNDLVEPISVLSGTTPVWRDSLHYFFKLGDFEGRLRDSESPIPRRSIFTSGSTRPLVTSQASFITVGPTARRTSTTTGMQTASTRSTTLLARISSTSTRSSGLPF